MELRHTYFIYIGIGVMLVLAALFFIKFKRKKTYRGGRKVLNNLITEEPYYRKRKIIYKVFSGTILAAALAGIMGSFILLARPVKSQIVYKNEYNRDIMLCIDISTSVDYLNENVISELKDTVKNLKGERFGILIFNTSPVLLVPLTDDYEFVLEQLDTIEESLQMRVKYEKFGYYSLPDNWLYLDEYITAGTLVGNEERGSSLIGDGLAAAVYDFMNFDEERSRIIIMTTDNELSGEPIVTFTEACEIAKENDVTVYGIGTKEMWAEDMAVMKAGVESTGGAFFLEEESGSFEQIINSINKISKTLLQGESGIKKTDSPFMPFLLLLCASAVMVAFTKITKR